jgi:hypothetical protein
VAKPDGRRPLGNRGVDEKILLKWILENCDRGLDWDQAQDMCWLLDFVDAIINFRVS